MWAGANPIPTGQQRRCVTSPPRQSWRSLCIQPAAIRTPSARFNPVPEAPASVTATDNRARTATIARNPVPSAAFYRIGCISLAQIPHITVADCPWMDALTFTETANSGGAEHIFDRLRPGARYAFIVSLPSRR